MFKLWKSCYLDFIFLTMLRIHEKFLKHFAFILEGHWANRELFRTTHICLELTTQRDWYQIIVNDVCASGFFKCFPDESAMQRRLWTLGLWLVRHLSFFVTVLLQKIFIVQGSMLYQCSWCYLSQVAWLLRARPSQVQRMNYIINSAVSSPFACLLRWESSVWGPSSTLHEKRVLTVIQRVKSMSQMTNGHFPFNADSWTHLKGRQGRMFIVI